MIQTDIIETAKGAAIGFRIDLDYRPPPLLIIQAEHGYLACSYISKETVAKTEDCMAIITGVNSFEDMLKERVIWASEKAIQKGVHVGMHGEDALNKFME
ncbi:MAG: DUF1805 domain-containing protein [Candidatus Diapherotrites archaeon]|nr:DUF1805 domain-containing protein [Candidatus Diapherotrites archaeon]